MKELELIVKNLDKIGTELFNKFGTDSYNIRCELHDIKDQLKAINYSQCCKQLLCVDKWCYNDLTKGKKYKLITEEDEYYTIVNDWGEIRQKDKDLFKIIKQ